MRVMVIMKSDVPTEAGVPPRPELQAEMGRFNEELVRSGVLLAAEGLYPSAHGKRVTFGHGDVEVADGPFGTATEQIAGFWLMQVKSMDEAVEWVKRVPNPLDAPTQIEIRQVFEGADFAPPCSSPQPGASSRGR